MCDNDKRTAWYTVIIGKHKPMTAWALKARVACEPYTVKIEYLDLATLALLNTSSCTCPALTKHNYLRRNWHGTLRLGERLYKKPDTKKYSLFSGLGSEGTSALLVVCEVLERCGHYSWTFEGNSNVMRLITYIPHPRAYAIKHLGYTSVLPSGFYIP